MTVEELVQGLECIAEDTLIDIDYCRIAQEAAENLALQKVRIAILRREIELLRQSQREGNNGL